MTPCLAPRRAPVAEATLGRTIIGRRAIGKQAPLAAGLLAALALAACDSAPPAAEAPPRAEATAEAPLAETAPLTAAPARPAPDAAPPALTAAEDGAPAFAALYPGARVQDDPVTAGGPAGPGGLVTFVTDDAPDAVVAFYRQRAEAAGLTSVMAMTQGEARAYGAAKGAEDGPSVQVVAAPDETGATSVQLAWSRGR